MFSHPDCISQLGRSATRLSAPSSGESCVRRAATAINRLLDFAVWKDWRFTMYTAAQTLGVMCNVPVWMLLPAVAQDNGLSKETATLALSAIAAADIAGRSLSGFVFDLPSLRRQRYRLYSGCWLVIATVMLWLPFAASPTSMLITAVVFGFALGVVVAQRSNILRDLIGVERFSSALGMMIFGQGFGVFVGPFLTGEWLV